MRILSILTCLLLAAAAPQAAAQSAEAWQIGPIIRGKNYSVGMPLHPSPARRGWSFEFPYPHEAAGHVHYVSTQVRSLAGASGIAVRYRVESAPGAAFIAREPKGSPAKVSLYFQRRGDRWSGRKYELFRWYAPEPTLRQIAPGTYEMRAAFAADSWISVWGKPSGSYRQAFDAALAEADRAGLVFGSPGARGHGVFSTAPARFTLLSFEIF